METKPDKKRKDNTSYAAWHFILAEILKRLIDSDDLEIYPFQKLGTLPLESDFIIMRKKSTSDLVKLYPDFAFMMPYLGKYTVIEYKSPLDKLTFSDFDTARVYMLLAKAKYNIVYDKDIHVITLASKFQEGYAEYLRENNFKFDCIEQDTVYGHESKTIHFYWIDLKKLAAKNPHDFINAFSSGYKKFYKKNVQPDMKHFDLLLYIYQLVTRKDFAMNNINIRQTRGYDQLIGSMDSFKKEIRNEFLASLKPEDVLSFKKGIRNEFLASLKPKERLMGLKPKERLMGLKPEERLIGLKPKERKELLKLLMNNE